MSNHSTDQKSPPVVRPSAKVSRPRVRYIAPVELAGWLEGRLPGLRQQWAQRLHANGPRQSEAWDRLIEEFVEFMTSFLPAVLGPLRDEAEQLWTRTAELFGAAAAKRGLAAGEVIEELQVLRELVIRDLYREPPMGGRVPLSLREILRLSRAIDRAVTHGSIGHTDALFFQLLEQEGTQDGVDGDDVAGEVAHQLRLIKADSVRVLASTPPQPQGGAGAH